MGKSFRIVSFVGVLALILPQLAARAISITGSGPVTENFDSMAATLNLPTSGWRIAAKTNAPTWAIGVNSVTAQASSGAPSAGGTYNWGATGATDRAVGAMTSGSFGSPNSLMVALTNDAAMTITNLAVGYNLEIYRTNTAAASVQFFYSTDGSTWNAVSAGDVPGTSLPTGTSTYGYPSRSIPVSFSVGGIAVSAGGVIYLRWNLNTTGSSSQGIGVDDVSITASLAVVSGIPDPLVSLVATVVSPSQIDLSWQPNAATDQVLVAYATNSTFGIPAGAYVASNAIAGGGEVLYVGALTNVSHIGLAQNKTYYYRAFSVNNTNYSSAISANGTTPIALPPFLAITNPPLGSNDVANAVTSVDLQGIGTNLANDIAWSNRNTGAVGYGGPAGATWSISVPVAVGANQIVVRGSNSDGFATAPVTTLVYRALPPAIPSPSDAGVWINEFHYDNAGTDTNEGVEVAGPAGTDLSGYAITFYNGSTNGVNLAYSNFVLTGTIDDEGCGYGAVWFPVPVNGLQNGGGTNPPAQPDGIALSQGTNVLLFLSYEGSLIASDGVAAGYQSIDVGVQESGTTNDPLLSSLQLLSAATSYVGFIWAGPVAPASPGSLNSGQTISSCGNVAPVLAAIGNQVATNGGSFTLPVSATDTVDGDVIALTASNLPPGAVFVGATNAASVNASLTWSPVGAVGVYTTTFYAVDNDGVDTETITITVIPGTPPLIAPLTNVTVWLNGSVVIPVTALPTESDVVTLSASNLPAGATFGSTNEMGTFTWASATPVGVYTAAFYAVDDDGVTSRTVTVTVRKDVSQFGTNVVLYQGFETTDTWTIVDGTGQVSTTTGVADFPGTGRIYAGSASWQSPGAASSTLTLASASIYGFTNRCVALRVSSTAITSGNGADAGDFVSVYVALNGAAFAPVADLTLTGNNNARWFYAAGLQGFTEAGVATSVATPQSGESLNNYGQLVVGIPDSVTSFAVRVIARNDANEIWNIDDIRVLGSVGFPASTDDDGDLLPNVWENQYFAGNTNANASTDSDLDGFDNLSEFIAGTVPTSNTSFPKVDVIANSNVTGRAVSFLSVTGRLYDVQVVPDMLSGGWSNLQTGVAGNGSPISVNDNAADTNRFYRIGIKLAP